MSFSRKAVFALLISLAFGTAAALPAHADTINGLTFAVADDGIFSTGGTHFHSNSAGAFGTPRNKAEVGTFFGEVISKLRK